MCDKYQSLLYFLLGSDSVSIESVANYLNISIEDAGVLIDKCISDGYLINCVLSDGSVNYHVVLDNVEVAISKHKLPIKEKECVKGKSTDSNSGELFSGIIFLVISVIVLCFFLYSCVGGEKDERDFCNDEDYAYVAAKNFIKGKLKSPSSAKFSHITETSVAKYDGCVFEFSGYVDAQNSFGASIRDKYQIKLKYSKEKDSYTVISFSI